MRSRRWPGGPCPNLLGLPNQRETKKKKCVLQQNTPARTVERVGEASESWSEKTKARGGRGAGGQGGSGGLVVSRLRTSTGPRHGIKRHGIKWHGILKGRRTEHGMVPSVSVWQQAMVRSGVFVHSFGNNDKKKRKLFVAHLPAQGACRCRTCGASTSFRLSGAPGGRPRSTRLPTPPSQQVPCPRD